MRESCISHRPSQSIAVVREDYYQLMNKDCVAAALLNVFEYWANGAIAGDQSEPNPWVGIRKITEFEQMLLGISTDKQIRLRLRMLEQKDFIQVQRTGPGGKTLKYRFMVEKVQAALDDMRAESRNTQNQNGQMTAQGTENGQMTDDSAVKQPFIERSNNRSSLYKKDQEELLEEGQKNLQESKEDGEPEPQAPTIGFAVNQPPTSATKQANSGDKYSADFFLAEDYDQLFVHRKKLPPWRVGWGMNDWDSNALEFYISWADAKFSKKHERVDAVMYFSKREGEILKRDLSRVPGALAILEWGRKQAEKVAQVQASLQAAGVDTDKPVLHCHRDFVPPVDDSKPMSPEALQAAQKRAREIIATKRKAQGEVA